MKTTGAKMGAGETQQDPTKEHTPGPFSREGGLGASTCLLTERGRQEPRTTPGTDSTSTVACGTDCKKHILQNSNIPETAVSVCCGVNGI